MGAVWQSAFTAAYQQQYQSFFDPVVAVDGGGERGAQLVHQIRLTSQCGDAVVVFFGEGRCESVGREQGNACGHHQGTEHTGNGSFGGGRDSFVDANDGNTVSRFGVIPEIALEDSFHRARKLPGGCSFRELLHGDGLVVDVSGETELGGEQIAVFVTGGVDGGSWQPSIGGDVTVVPVADFASGGAVVHGADEFGADQGAASDDAAHLDELSQEG